MLSGIAYFVVVLFWVWLWLILLAGYHVLEKDNGFRNFLYKAIYVLPLLFVLINAAFWMLLGVL